MIHRLKLAALALTLGAITFVATEVSAAPILGLQLHQAGFADLSSSSSTNPLVLNQSFGSFSVNVATNALAFNPLAIDLASVNISTATGGTLYITASVSNLTSAFGAANFLSQFSGNLTRPENVTGVELTTYFDNTNTLFGQGTMLSKLSSGSTTPFSLSTYNIGELANPFTLTEVIKITTTGETLLSLDGSLQVADVPEPTALALLGIGLLGISAFRRRREAIA